MKSSRNFFTDEKQIGVIALIFYLLLNTILKKNKVLYTFNNLENG